MIKSIAILSSVVVVLVGIVLATGIALGSSETIGTTEVTDTNIPASSSAELTELPVLEPAQLESGSTISEIYATAVQSVVSVNSNEGNGSGWVWSADGYVVTNYHVVQCSQCQDGVADEIEVVFFDALEYEASLVAFDATSDLAVLRVVGRENLSPLPVGDSENIVVGQTVFAVGSPFGQDFSITAGIVSALNREINSGFSNYRIPDVIQTDAALNPGNSGGPLIDAHGRIIGINTQINTTTGSNSGIGYAIPINIALRIVPRLIVDGFYEYAWLGVSGATVDRDIREAIDLDETVRGFMVFEVTPDSPADLADIRGATVTGTNTTYDGDIIIGIQNGNGEQFSKVGDFEELISFLTLYASPGDTLSLLVLRDSEEVIVTPTLKTRPQNTP